MKFKIPIDQLNHQPQQIIRRLGYLKITDPHTGNESFAKKIGRENYPRFHLYLTQKNRETIFDLHLDQSKVRYEGQKAHNADYETEEVKEELTRIYLEIKNNLQN